MPLPRRKRKRRRRPLRHQPRSEPKELENTMTTMTEEKALKMFGQGFDCSQVVLGDAAEKVGISRDQALKTAAAFGGGMWHGETCGCVTGGLMAIGLAYGTVTPGDAEGKTAMLGEKQEFEKLFTEEYGSCLCREILKEDLSDPEGMKAIQEQGLLESFCPKVAACTCKILDEMI